MKTLKNIVSFMEEYTDTMEGILVSKDSSLSLMQFLFLDGLSDVTLSAVQFLQQQMTMQDSALVSVFIYYASFMYGVVGISAQSLTFLTYEHVREYEGYAEWFKELGLRLVITDDIMKREGSSIGEARYIGYIRLSGEEERVNLYEILDVCPMRERQAKLIDKEKFEAAIRLYYQKDFYSARNRFSEILKDCPDDEMARWYLFESEKYIGETPENDGFGALRAEAKD